MNQPLLSRHSGPLVALGGLVAAACLVGSWQINRLQEDLARTVRHDTAGVEAVDDLQLSLRHLRVHSLIQAAEGTDARRAVVRRDLARVDQALQTVLQTATAPEDAHLASRIQEDYLRYREDLERDLSPASVRSAGDLATWSDRHHMTPLLTVCQELADRKHQRMKDSLRRTEFQTVWAGRMLLGLGAAGVLGGLMSGYATARELTRREARLSVRVRAVQAQLDQDVAAMTVQRTADLGDLDQQLDRVIDRVQAVCRRLAEQERDLLRAEQLAAVGQLAAGVAHEVRNPLTGVKCLLQAAVRPNNPMPLTAERLHLVLQEVARIERTVQGLMDFAYTPPLDRHPHDLRAILAEAIEIVRGRAEMKAVSLRLETPAEPLRGLIDRDRFLSLLTNLLFNAIDAAPARTEVGVSASAGPDGKIKVAVSDAGPGIDHAVAARLFDPFVTTKTAGTGLGLTIARRVALEHGGSLSAAPRPGGGACFSLVLPAVEEADAETARG